MKTKLFITLLVVISGALIIVNKQIKQHHPIQKPKASKDVKLHAVGFSKLPGWNTTNMQKSFTAFKKSCSVFLRQDVNRRVGSEFISLRAGNWQPSCIAANKLDNPSSNDIRNFFQTNFQPYEMYKNNAIEGLFTGYYSPLFDGSLKKTDYYSVPIYGLPKQIVTAQLNKFSKKLPNKKIVGRVVEQKLIPYYTSKQIDEGALNGVAPVLAWIHSPLDRLVLSIEGSGAIKLPDGKQLMLGYAGENGAPYTPIAKVLIDKGIMTFDNASMQRISAYFNKHPDQMNKILHCNKSFVFFTLLKNTSALGAQGISLTAGYSMAVDRRWLPMGAPLWLSTTAPDEKGASTKEITRLMIAQDTGGAINGPVRGDFYWGEGQKAASIAGRMKNKGIYWVLLPKNIHLKNAIS